MKYLLTLLMIAGSLSATTQPRCDSSRLPVVLVHGFLASGDTWAGQAQRFYAHGYCRERIYAFDWNTTGGKKTDSLLHDYILQVLKKTGARQINLAGHSAGGGLCYRYLQQPGRAGLVAHYAHIGSNRISMPAGEQQQVPTLLIRSKADRVIPDTAFTPVNTVQLQDQDHLQVATSAGTFRELYRFFNHTEAMPEPASSHQGTTVQISGRVVTMGDNEVQQHTEIKLYELDPYTGLRNRDVSAVLLKTDETGNWGPVSVKTDRYLEMEIPAKQGQTVRYFFEPFREHNHLVYLRTLPVTGLGALLLKKLPAYPDRATLAVFSQSGAIIAQRDSLSVNGYSLCTESLAPAAATVIASFVFDDGDGVSSGKKIPGFGSGIFLNAADICLTTNGQQSIHLFYNGRNLRLPAVPGSEALLVAVFQ